LRVSLVSQEVRQGLAGTVFDVVAGGTAMYAAHPGGEDGWRRHLAVTRILSHLGLDGDAAFASLSGGTNRPTLLARALEAEPDILLLDEPTNDLGAETIDCSRSCCSSTPACCCW
jgi:ATPase subunit of ABC transporter with duplicated ATPase domains